MHPFCCTVPVLPGRSSASSPSMLLADLLEMLRPVRSDSLGRRPARSHDSFPSSSDLSNKSVCSPEQFITFQQICIPNNA
ncbi:hypothetical protein CKAN_00566700 [Cinnamomum micranthum f. kanehirae]|uniref:Uncharacterized protein n=1 Tax=Cinnamomum micranthum f. kanehirae TaxID=337451 RepID=A0A443NF82_9MAGN|nr:hypothetical protein CKAN_00566700 [Cinnamomum micranthum f. kanehirae]